MTNIRSFMKKPVNLPIPVIKVLNKLGKDLRDARLRRRITVELMAERAGLSRATITKIEKGDPTTSLGAYSSVLFVLGLTERLNETADLSNDFLGRHLEEEELPKRIRLPKKRD